MKILSGHVSQETAYVVNDYPYGFRLRCKIRYWLEKHGTRLLSQTTNPKKSGTLVNLDTGEKTRREVWNKPKASTYAHIAGAMYLDEEEHVQWSGLSIYDDSTKAQGWLDEFRGGLPPEVIRRAELWIEKRRGGDIKCL